MTRIHNEDKTEFRQSQKISGAFPDIPKALSMPEKRHGSHCFRTIAGSFKTLEAEDMVQN
jgi:hypothetical protein